MRKANIFHRMDADDIMPINKLGLMIDHWKPKSVVTGKVSYFSSDWLVGLGFQNYEKWINQLMEKPFGFGRMSIWSVQFHHLLGSCIE